MQTSGLEITRFMLDDAFWKSAASSSEEYELNGVHFDGNILLARASDHVVIKGGVVHIDEGVDVSLLDFFKQWREQAADSVVAVNCAPARRAELILLLATHGFELAEQSA